jgi:hypothetical protein
MTEYRKQAAFIRRLVSYDTSGEGALLLERLQQAQKNERCIFSACVLVALLACFGLAGLGYSAVLLPQFFHNSTHVLIRLFGALGLGSGLCFVFFVGLWRWYRGGVNRVHEECRKLVTRMLEAHFGAAPLDYAVELKVLKVPEEFGDAGLRKAS